MKKKLFLIAVISLFASLGTFGQGYKQPPKEVMDVLSAPATPTASVGPDGTVIALLEPLRYPPIAELAQPMLRIGGLRINPNTNGQHRTPYYVSLKLRGAMGGAERPVVLPAGAQIISPMWSADGKYIAAGNITETGIELWIIDVATAKAKLIPGIRVNTTLGGFGWMPDQRSLIVNTVPATRGPAPKYQNLTPTGPSTQETAGKSGAVQTVQDLLKSPNDEKLFEYYTTSQLTVVGIDGKTRNIGTPAIFDGNDVSPDGRFILVSKVEKPFSYLFPYNRFPNVTEVWDISGKKVYEISRSPLQDNLPIQGVPTGPRSEAWIPTEPATLTWAEALDGGDPRKKVSPRDRLVMLAAPFTGAPVEIAKVEQRFQGRMFGERDGLMLFGDYNRDTDRRRLFAVDYRNPTSPKQVFDLNINDRYNDPGQPVMKRTASGDSVVRMNGDEVFMSGTGASTKGDRPFLRAMNLKTGAAREIFRSGEDEYASFVSLLSDDASSFIIRREDPTSPPNLYMVKADGGARVPMTAFADPTPQLRGIKKQLVRYKRADGVDLSFTLYLPPNYKEGERLPAVVWAYPLEFTDASTAGQVSGSTKRFTTISGYSHLFFLLEGYAVLDDATMPVVGDPLTVNDTFVQQIVSSAKAAIDKGVEMGVVDPERVGVGGHSYGAFMTANLLAHSDLFRAGIARSGAYNRTLTPFGFQSERRSFWEAPELYAKVSPFFVADKLKEPILLIHGEADNNQGTFPIQSERMFAALQGNGGTARLVMLPHEAHGYSAKESTEHVLFEQIQWFDKYVKNAKPRK